MAREARAVPDLGAPVLERPCRPPAPHRLRLDDAVGGARAAVPAVGAQRVVPAGALHGRAPAAGARITSEWAGWAAAGAGAVVVLQIEMIFKTS